MVIERGVPGSVLETKTQIEMIARLALNIPTEDAEDVAEWLESQHTLLPIFDPTAYIAMGRNIDGHLALAVAFLAFRRALDGLMVTGGPR